MHAKPTSHRELYDRVAADVAEIRTRVAASRSELFEHIARSHEAIAQSRDLIARADAIMDQLRAPSSTLSMLPCGFGTERRL